MKHNLGKKTLALLLTIMMVVGMVPTMAIPASAEDIYYHLFPVKNGKLAYYYGYSQGYDNGKTWHDGIDIHSTGDDTIYAASSGVVRRVKNPCSCWNRKAPDGTPCTHYDTFGNYIRIDNYDGTYSYYGHLVQNSNRVTEGQEVSKGQPIATMGSSGNSTGKHLHYEVRYTTSSGNTINTNPVSNGGSISYEYTEGMYGGNSYLAKCTPTTVHCKLTVTINKIYIKTLPCSRSTDASSDDITTAAKGATFDSTLAYVNDQGNLWYQVKAINSTTGKEEIGYVYSGDVSSVNYAYFDVNATLDGGSMLGDTAGLGQFDVY